MIELQQQIFSALTSTTSVTSITTNIYPEGFGTGFPRLTYQFLENPINKEEKYASGKYWYTARPVVQLKASFAKTASDPGASAMALLKAARRAISPARLSNTTLNVGKVITQTENVLLEAEGAWVAVGRYQIIYAMNQ